MRLTVEISQEELEGDYGYVEGIRLTCPRCGHDVTVFGTSERSAQRGAIMLREECPKGESNYYDVDDWV